MSAAPESTKQETAPPETKFAAFLESHPPGQRVVTSDLARIKPAMGTASFILSTPEIHLHCPTPRCGGIRVFRSVTGEIDLQSGDEKCVFLTYCCWNCQSEFKIFALKVKRDGRSTRGDAYKIGEFPTFGPPTPARLLRLIQDDKDTMLSGRRCENQGLGIGAFVYYRRVVENQKNRILGEIKRVLENTGAKPELCSLLEDAIAEIQFKKAMQIAKDAIPDSLLINGHNPLTLLHSALSEGVHELSDGECLEMATSVRVVLTELSERLAQLLKDEAELSNAVNKLANRKKA